MKHLLPDRVELSLMGALALLCALVVAHGVNADYLLAILAVPLFVASAVMGLRRNWKLADESSAKQDAAA